jgi:Holin of 3TMs, for gene-transfer release
MSIWDTIAAPIIAIINKVVPDKAAAAQAVATLNQMTLQGQLQDEYAQLQAITVNQTDVNKVEAANPSLFVAGGRPAIIWICAGALFCQYILRPLVTAGFIIAGKPLTVPLPGLDDTLWQLMFGMLGLGAMRSYDKVKGVDTKGISK